ncbi:P-loop containing nucleoside triphosphate hydrolase protein [Haematococcus lacustris]
MSMLAGPDGQLPEEIEKLDPKIVDMVCNEVLDSGSAVQWADIAGLEVAKKRLQEIIVWPMLNPHLFTGARAPPKGLLLFGPPGTGKTLIGKAIASNISATFFSISASSLTSKWIGEGEKMVRALFTVAACLQPSVIFIDEIDSVLSARKAEGEHEASRRLKTEMLIQMDGCSGSGERRLLVLGATNRPEELDEAARRRMPKQLYIPLPCAAARLQMIQRQLGPGSDVAATLSDQDLAKITAKTQGYSGSDMRFLIQEACQGPVRDAMAEHAGALAQLREGDLRPVMLRDFQMAARVQKASVTASEVVRYEEYDQKHGSKDPNAASDTAAEADEDW